MNKIKSKKPIIFILSLVAIFAAAIPSFSTSSAPVSGSDNAIKNINEQSATEVFSYVDVFESYYEKATNALLNNGLEMTLSFDEFCDGYYSNDDDIATYTDNVIDNVINNKKNTSLIKTTTLSSSSSTANYILKSYVEYTSTPKSYFRRAPVYDETTYDYSLLMVGDIVYETKATYSWLGVDHTAIISSVSHASYYGSYVQTIEAVSPNVSYGMLDDTRMVDFGVEILRVVGTTATKRNNVLTFAKAQVGKPYSLDILSLNKSISSTGWYCSELVYASWKYAGIDVSRRYNSSGNIIYATINCMPSDIYDSFNTEIESIKSKYFIDLELTSGSKWTIKIYNNTGSGRTVRYNSKMAFLDDAKNWTSSLTNKKSVYVSSGSTKTVTIATNWFATSITTSVVVGKIRYVTYANELSSSGGYSMSIGYNTVSA